MRYIMYGFMTPITFTTDDKNVKIIIRHLEQSVIKLKIYSILNSNIDNFCSLNFLWLPFSKKYGKWWTHIKIFSTDEIINWKDFVMLMM